MQDVVDDSALDLTFNCAGCPVHCSSKLINYLV